MSDADLATMAAQSTGQKLLKAARLLDERALAVLASVPGAPPVRPAHTRLFPHLDFQGVRASDLAQKLGVTKQAVGPLVAELVGWGLLEQVPDPEDGRARLVRFSRAGLEGMARGLGALQGLEAEVAETVGPEKMAVFREVLDVWLDQLERDSGG